MDRPVIPSTGTSVRLNQAGLNSRSMLKSLTRPGTTHRPGSIEVFLEAKYRFPGRITHPLELLFS